MHTLEITIQRRSGTQWPVVAEECEVGVFLRVRTEGFLELDVQVLSVADPSEYGVILGRALFRDNVEMAFTKALARAKDALHVLLSVEDDGAGELRWERLCGPLDGGWHPLALHQRVPFSRYLPSTTDRRFPPIGRADLRMLIVAASPAGLEQYRLRPFDEARAVEAVRSALGDRMPVDVLARVPGALGSPTLDALCDQITAGGYTLLHVVCHGASITSCGESGSEPKCETVLYLSDASGTIEPVAATELIRRLSLLRGAKGLPQLAFLASCESALPGAEGALGGLGQRLVRELGMPAVVAMTDKVTVETAHALAAAFYRRLHEHGVVDLALSEAFAGLATRPDAEVPVPALFSRLGGRPLFSGTLGRELTPTEVARGFGRMADLFPDRAPGLLGDLERVTAALSGFLRVDASELAPVARKEREVALSEINDLCGEVLEMSFKALAGGQEPPRYLAGECPFRGLYPFTFSDRKFFFGREGLIDKLQAHLSAHDFLAVVGPSGCGKSSVVLAGLLPRVCERETDFVELTPGPDPLASLEAHLERADGRARVLVVDQCEELFTHCSQESIRRAFLDRLLALPGSLKIVITLREDFRGECDRYSDLRSLLDRKSIRVPRMGPEELRRVMEMQASAVGLRFEADLGQQIFDDVRDQPGAMPLLQHALLELWNHRHGRWLMAAEYRTLGKVQGAIANTAERFFNRTSRRDHLDGIRDIFLRLTRPDPDRDGAIGPVALQDHGRPGDRDGASPWRDTRRRIALDELVPSDGDAGRIKSLVADLAGADTRLVVTSLNPMNGREEVEVAHEALIRHWPRLQTWLDESAEAVRLREQIREAAQRWLDRERDPNLLLHRGAYLAGVVARLDHSRIGLNHTEKEYVNLCIKNDRVLSRLLSARGVSLVISIAVVSFLVMLRPWKWWSGDTEVLPVPPPPLVEPTSDGVVYLDQNWAPADRLKFYNTSASSRLLPYEWLLGLEQSDSDRKFIDDLNMLKLGFIPQGPGPANPDRLPVGFVRDDGRDRAWFGFSCAACHTGQVDYKGVGYRIDGGPALGDIAGLLRSITTALVATRDQADKFDRFASRVLMRRDNPSARATLKDELIEVIRRREGYDARNLPPGEEAGHGRFDTLGVLMNEVYHRAVRANDRITPTVNCKPADAPASIPFLWDTPQHDLLNWNGSARNDGPSGIGAIGRDVSEVIGVFGDFEIPESIGLTGYSSSIHMKNISSFENLISSLWSPQWPKDFPPVDAAMRDQGWALYRELCLECHQDIDRRDPDRKVIAIMRPTGTDPRLDANYRGRVGRSGKLEGAYSLFFPSMGRRIPAVAPAGEMLNHVVIGIIAGSTDPPPADVLTKIELAARAKTASSHGIQSASEPGPTYKARPLNGIWATAPYLHNGSVPTLDDLLKPAKERPKSFSVGTREFDPVKVGFRTDATNVSKFRVEDEGKTIPGNSNVGHEYGCGLKEQERLQLLEYLKSL